MHITSNRCIKDDGSYKLLIYQLFLVIVLMSSKGGGMFFFLMANPYLGEFGNERFSSEEIRYCGDSKTGGGGRSEPPIVRKNGVIGRGPEINGPYIYLK